MHLVFLFILNDFLKIIGKYYCSFTIIFLDNNISRNEGSLHASDAQMEDDVNVENIPAGDNNYIGHNSKNLTPRL